MRLRASCLAAILAAAASSALLNSSTHAQSPSAKSSAQKSWNVSQRITLTPKYVQGQIVRYQMQATTVTDTHHGGAIRDPQGPTKMTVVWNAITRLEVLSMESNAQGDSTGTMRLRSTYEKSDATSESGSYDPEADGIAQKYRAEHCAKQGGEVDNPASHSCWLPVADVAIYFPGAFSGRFW